MVYYKTIVYHVPYNLCVTNGGWGRNVKNLRQRKGHALAKLVVTFDGIAPEGKRARLHRQDGEFLVSARAHRAVGFKLRCMQADGFLQFCQEPVRRACTGQGRHIIRAWTEGCLGQKA